MMSIFRVKNPHQPTPRRREQTFVRTDRGCGALSYCCAWIRLLKLVGNFWMAAKNPKLFPGGTVPQDHAPIGAFASNDPFPAGTKRSTSEFSLKADLHACPSVVHPRSVST